MAAASPRPRPPWPLLPKLVCVALLLGSFVSVLALIYALPRDGLESWGAMVDAVGTLFRLVIVPSSFGAVVFSLLLFWSSRRTFLRQRWAQVKVALLVATLPALHLLARGTFTAIRQELAAGSEPTGLLDLFTLLVVVTIVVLLVALWLARAKPRLGQRAAEERG